MNRKAHISSMVLAFIVVITLIVSAINPTAAYASGPAIKVTPPPTRTPKPTSTPRVTPTPVVTPTPFNPDPVLTVQSDATYIAPGEQVMISYQITNFEKLTGSLLLRFSSPMGFSPAYPNEGKWEEATGIFEYPISVAEGKLLWRADSKVQPPFGLTIELVQDGNAISASELILDAVAEFKVEPLGGEAAGMNGRVKVNFPGGAVSESVKVKVTRPSAESLPVQSLSGAPFELTAISDTTKGEVSKFTAPVEIQVHYDWDGNGDEDGIRLYWYDPSDRQWKPPLDQHVDTENKVIIAHTDHFTVFDTYNSGWQSAETPTMSMFQTPSYTGASSFSMPIKVPAGPGGLQPSLTLSYNGQVVDSVNTESQASWVGMGWSLDAGGYIERNGSGTKDQTDDSFSVNANGISGELWIGADGRYHLGDENFANITYDSNANSWTILDKTGNKYIFSETAGVTKTVDDGTTHTVEALTWRWMLKEFDNVYGKKIKYTYAREGHSYSYYDPSTLTTTTYADTTYIYPQYVTYDHDRYRIRFERLDRYDYKTQWLTAYQNGDYRTFQLSLLKEIYVEQDTNGLGSWTTIHKYVFNYKTNGGETIFPYYIWPSLHNYGTPTLDSVYEYGMNGAGPLPNYSFTYGDGKHLTHASNGYGGGIDYTYNTWVSTIPLDSIANGTLEPSLPRWGNPVKCQFENSNCSWQYETNQYGAPDGSVGGGNNGFIRIYHNVKKEIDTYQPDHWYRIVAQAKSANSATPSIELGYRLYLQGVQQNYVPLTTSTLNSSLKTLVTDPFYLPMDTTKFTLKMYASGHSDLYWYYLVPLSSYARVTSRTLSDGTNSYAFTYGYDDPQMNMTSNSDVLQTNHPNVNAYTDFRGHGTVTETDPYGKQTITTYNRTDCLSGRPSSVTTKNGSVVYQVSTTTYACTETESTAVLIDKDWPYEGQPNQSVQYTGLRYRWVRTMTESLTTYQANGVDVAGTMNTSYTYDDTLGTPYYGNQILKTQSGGGVTLNTHTTYMQNTSNGRWLVELPIDTWVDAGAGKLTETINLYEDANNPGIQTGARTLMDYDQSQQGMYSQTNMTHDAWGNVTSQTTWSGYGSASVAPTTGARTSFSAYDSTYHTYAISTTDALGHVSTVSYDYTMGLPVCETDPNGAVTKATYDNFGRFTSLAKPNVSASCSDSLTPVLAVSYVNSPFTVTMTQTIDSNHQYTMVRSYDGLGRQVSTVVNPGSDNIQTSSTFNAYGKPIDQSTAHNNTETVYYSTTHYDSLGRPQTVSDFHLANVNNPPILTTYTYDGFSAQVTDAKGHTTTTQADVWGRTTSITPPATADNSTPQVTFTYNAIGNMLTASRGGSTVTLKYDNAGRKVAMDDPDLGMKSGDTQWGWVYQYDALGNMLNQTDNRSCLMTITYDSLNRPLTKTSSNCPGNVGATPAVTYTYDSGTNGIGRRASMGVSGGDYTSWSYDLRGRIVSENKQTLPGGGHFITGFTYNSADLPATITYPDNEVVTFGYNNRMAVEKVYNDNGTPANLTDDINYALTVAYDSASRVKQIVRGTNVLSTMFNFNNWNVDGGRLLSITTTRPSDSTTLQTGTYDYDAVGNILAIVGSVNQAPQQKQTFTYDELDRITNSSVSGGTTGRYTEGYSFETGTGNLKTKNSSSYAYDATHKHAVASLSNGNTYNYDANGNMTSRHIVDPGGNKDYTLTYDAENRLTAVTGASTANLYYDGDGKQVKTIVNGATTFYVGNHYEVKNSVVTKYYFAGTTRLAVRTAGTLTFLLADHLGSTTLSTNASGAVNATALYKAFGELRSTPSALGTDYKFTGQREEASLGLYFFNARWFDPSLGRFTSPDTIVPTSTQGTQAWDRYAYVNNNPVAYYDSTGHDATSTSYTYSTASDFSAATITCTNDINFVRGIIQLDMDAGGLIMGVVLAVAGAVATSAIPVVGPSLALPAAVAGFGAGLGGAIKLSGDFLDRTMGQDTTNLSQMSGWVKDVFNEDGVTSVTVTVTNTQTTVYSSSIIGTGIPVTYTVQTVTICSNNGICNTWTTSSCPSDQHAIQRVLTPAQENAVPNTESASVEHEKN
jgi:RHS repeat-associated protein